MVTNDTEPLNPVSTTRNRRPKAANGIGGARKRPNGSWAWRLTLEDGRRESAYDRDQKAARRKCLAKADLLRKGVDPTASRQTLGNFLSWWLADVVAPRREPKTVSAYRYAVNYYVIPALGRIQLGKVTPQQVQTLLRNMERDGKSPRTVAMVRTVLRTALQQGVKLGMVERNVAALVDAPPQVRVERKPLTADEARQLLDAARGDPNEAVYRLALTLGLRLGEALAVRWCDVNLDGGELRVARNLQRVKLDQVRPEHEVVAGGRRGGSVLLLKVLKTRQSRRTLVLPPSLVEALRSQRDRQAFARSAAGDRWRDTDLVFTTPIGTAIDPDNLRKQWKSLLQKAGIRDQRFHDLRHAAASLMVADGVPMTAVSRVLGHSVTSTTMNLYAHAMPGAEREAAMAMERLLG
jgi:integrase